MSKLSRALAVTSITVLSSVFTLASAQDAGEIREIINGRKVDLNCTTFFPNLPHDKNPAADKIALIDSAVYHAGQMTTTKYALMNKNERKNYWTKPVAHPFNRLPFERAAQKYDHADDKIETLKKLMANVHTDFPVSRWDQLASQCATKLRYD